MYFVKAVSVVGICAVSALPLSATAQRWIVNCETSQCLDVTEDGDVQTSKCDETKTYQQWDVNVPGVPQGKIANRGKNECLDVFNDKSIHTTSCEPWKNFQQWKFPCLGNLGTRIKSDHFDECVTTKDKSATPAAILTDCQNAAMWRCVNVGDPNLSCPQ
jgi:hypothetical protein